MPGAAIESLEELLRALSRERSLRGRLRVIGQGWALLRTLSPADRQRVAMRMGSNWAWKRVERSFLEDGELDEDERLLGRVFERMGESDPEELRELAGMVRARDREGLTDALMIGLHEALEEEAQEEEEEEASRTPAEQSVPSEVDEEPEPEVAATETPAIVESAGEVLASSLARTVEPAGAPAPEIAEARSEDPAPPAEKPAPAAMPVREAPSPPAPAAPASPIPEPFAETPPAPAPPPLEVHLDLPDEVAAGNGADRLRALRALRNDPGHALGRAGRARLLESLGGGWASRRALSLMIGAGALDDLDEALDLVSRLARPGQQTWCLGDLLEHWPLDSAARERIVAAAPSDAARRRLRMRSASAGRSTGIPAATAPPADTPATSR